MTLSADILNQRSPYKLSQLGEFTFRFVTDQDIHYTVGFYKDTIFMDDGAYHFFIDNSEHEHGSYDPKILDVVTVILEEFFSQEPTSCSISVTLPTIVRLHATVSTIFGFTIMHVAMK